MEGTQTPNNNEAASQPVTHEAAPQPAIVQPPMQNGQAPAQPAYAPQQVVVKKKSNALLIVLIVLLVLCGLCAASVFVLFKIGQSKVKTELDRVNNEIKKQQDMGITTYPTGSSTDSGSGSTNDPESGETTTPGSLGGNLSTEIPSNFPKDIPVYPGSKVGVSSNDTKKGESLVNLNSTDASSKVLSYYKSNLPKNGWKLDQEFNLFGNTLLFSKGDQQLTIVILGDEKGANITLTVTKKQ